MEPPPIPPERDASAGGDDFWISVQIDPAYEDLLDADHLQRLALFTLLQEGHRETLEVGIIITNDQEIHTLNKQYLAHDYPTDVLSFGAGTAVGERPTPAGADPEDDGEGAEQDTVGATDYVTEGYEGDQEESGAVLPDADEPEEDTASSGAAGPAVAFVTPPGWPVYLGDVVISYDTAAAQAADYGHPPAAEVDVLLVHGLLHLLGYDDQAPAAHDEMHARQAALLAAFAASI